MIEVPTKVGKTQQLFGIFRIRSNYLILLVARAGIEPATQGFSVHGDVVLLNSEFF